MAKPQLDPDSGIIYLDGETPEAPEEGEPWEPGPAADLQLPTMNERVISPLTRMTNETCRSEELPTESKWATDMDKALVASRRHARGLHPDLREHSNHGSHTGPLVAFRPPQAKWSGRITIPTLKHRNSRISGTQMEQPWKETNGDLTHPLPRRRLESALLMKPVPLVPKMLVPQARSVLEQTTGAPESLNVQGGDNRH